MIKIIKEAQVRSEEDNRNLRETVAGIIGEVRGRGDAALREYNEKFDGCTRESLRVSREEIDAAYKELGEQELADLKAAHHNIEAFANAQRQTVKPLDNFSPEPPHHSGGVLLLLCAGRQLSAVFDGADVSDSGEGSGCKTYHRLLSGSAGNGSYQCQDAGSDGSGWRG